MSQQQWTAVDHYLTELFVPPDAVLDEGLQACAMAGLPPISVTPNQGKLLSLLARIHGARTILEIGTLVRLQGRVAWLASQCWLGFNK